jgi:hypothetical protein
MNVLGVKFMVDIPAAPGRSRMTSLEEANVEILREIAAGVVIDTRA